MIEPTPIITNKICLMIMGASGCGKSTLEAGLTGLEGVKKAVSVTTRSPRVGEVDGIDYKFITHNQFLTMECNDQLIQTTEFNTNRYGTAESEYTTDDQIVTLVVVPESAAVFKRVLAERMPNIRTLVVYFDISHQRLISNMKARGDSDETIANRIMDDDLDEQMKASGLIPDYIVTDDALTPDLTTKVALWLGKQDEVNHG